MYICLTITSTELQFQKFDDTGIAIGSPDIYDSTVYIGALSLSIPGYYTVHHATDRGASIKAAYPSPVIIDTTI